MDVTRAETRIRISALIRTASLTSLVGLCARHRAEELVRPRAAIKERVELYLLRLIPSITLKSQ